MVSPSPLKDIDDKFCVCLVCLDQLKEPKLIPCLHRYCKDCLGSITQGCKDVFKCPECREAIQIPQNGVDGFKTDFYSKSLVENVKIQQSLKSDEIRECYSCSKHLRIAAYCFKCNDFLCKDCHNVHMTNKTLKDHRKHTPSVEDIEAKNITIEKLASMRDTPRCHNHPQKVSELVCETCDNLVCMACTFGEHKGHGFHEVNAFAKVKRKELAQQINTLEKMKQNIKPTETRQAKEKLILNANIEREKFISLHNEKAQEIMKKIDEIERRREKLKQEKQNKEKQLSDYLQRNTEPEIERVKKNYDGEILKMKKIEINNDFQAQESSLEKELAKLKKRLEHFDRDKKELLLSIEKQLQQNTKIIETISEHFHNIRNRFELLKVLASRILACENDWSVVQCIPDMCTAAANIMKDLKKKFSDLKTLTDVSICYEQSFLGMPSLSKMSEKVEKKTITHTEYCVFQDIGSSSDGNIVISGQTSDWYSSFIIVIDVKGRVLKEKVINQGCTFTRYCDFLSQHKVATVCYPNEIGVYDLRDSSYVKKKISDVISSWPKDRYVHCVATDPVNNHIFLGLHNRRDVYVFDDQLKYLRMLKLPDMIKWPCDITVSDGHLLVCDLVGRKSYVITREGSVGKVVREFMKPNLEGNNFGPLSVCTGKDGFVYMLWKKFYPQQCFLVQYSQDGSQVLTTRKLDADAQYVTVVETSLGEKVVVVTYNTQTLYMYDIIKEDKNL